MRVFPEVSPLCKLFLCGTSLHFKAAGEGSQLFKEKQTDFRYL